MEEIRNAPDFCPSCLTVHTQDVEDEINWFHRPGFKNEIAIGKPGIQFSVDHKFKIVEDKKGSARIECACGKRFESDDEYLAHVATVTANLGGSNA